MDDAQGGTPVPSAQVPGTPVLVPPPAPPPSANWEAKQHPFMATNPRATIHNNGYMTDAYASGGPPLSKAQPTPIYKSLDGLCATHVFDADSGGNLLTVCIGTTLTSLRSRTMHALDPATLKVRKSIALPAAPGSPKSFSGGGYFYLDNNLTPPRSIIAASDRCIHEIGYDASTSTFKEFAEVAKEGVAIPSLPPGTLHGDKAATVGGYNIGEALGSAGNQCNATPSDEKGKIASVMPDSKGNYWAITEGDSEQPAQVVVARVGPDSQGKRTLQSVHKMDLSPTDTRSGATAVEHIVNSLATDNEGGIYIVSDYAMYRFDADGSNAPVVTWRATYDRCLGGSCTTPKPGQASIGSGTTPTLVSDQFVAIADGATPMKVVVFRREKTLPTGAKRLHCTAEALPGVANTATENSLVANGPDLYVENNYGYVDVNSTKGDLTTEPGIGRVTMKSNGVCSSETINKTYGAPSVVAKLSKANNLLYSYVKKGGDKPGWSFVGFDLRQGTATYGSPVIDWFIGTGDKYNNNFAPVTIGPSGKTYVGLNTGIVLVDYDAVPTAAQRRRR